MPLPSGPHGVRLRRLRCGVGQSPHPPSAARCCSTARFKVCSDRADMASDQGGGLVGPVLLVIGVFGFVAAAVVSRRAFAPAQPGGAETGDAPKGIPGAYIASLVIAIIGLLLIIF